MNGPEVVTIGLRESGPLTEWVLARQLSSVDDVLAAAPELARLATDNEFTVLDSWGALATLASFDLSLARTLEPHLDAMGILMQAGMGTAVSEWRDNSWGVFAAEGGPEPVRAREVANEWRLTGTKLWCSLAGRLDYALITAHVSADERALFAIDLRDNGVEVRAGEWHARGLVEIVSSSVRLSDVPGIRVGQDGWYFERPGFDVGGIGVAACWFGGAVGVARAFFESAETDVSSLSAMHLGAVDISLENSRLALANAAARVAGAEAIETKLLAKRVRGIVARTVEEVLWRVAHALGPVPLAQNEAHAKRVADLELYVRQHHAERDDESLGRLLRRDDSPPW
jgi:hypothetical protein